MNQLRDKLTAMGCACDDWDDARCKRVALAVGIEVPRTITIEEYKGAFYLKTDGYKVPHKSDPEKTSTAKGLYTRIEAWPELLKDIEAATPAVEKFLKERK